MAKLCKEKDLAGNPAYPDLHERDLNDMQDGDAVFATVPICIDGEDVNYAVPGQLVTVEGEQRVDFYHTDIWAQGSGDAPSYVVVEEAVHLRSAWAEVTVDPVLRRKMSTFFADEVEKLDFARRVVDKLYDTDKAFAKALDASKDKF